ncbi:MAG TPA: DUF1003 domain-containing protein [Jatrophihabitantaceae bacterium]
MTDNSAERHPVVVSELRRRRDDIQLRIADGITAFAGSMNFVYLHALLFAAWMIWLEKSPWPTLTLTVSLEAIFLSTFVMISQNRADEKREALGNQAWRTVQEEGHQNEELLRLSRQILHLTRELHRERGAASSGE